MSDLLSKVHVLLGELADAETHESTPPWVSSLFSAFRLILTDFEATNKALEKKVSILESSVVVSGQVSNLLLNENLRLSQEVDAINTRLEVMENYSRRNCLLVHGVEETERENVDAKVLAVFNERLGLDVDISLIDRSHRIGTKFTGIRTRNSKKKDRPIIVKFTSYRTRREVYSSKKKLKASGISISESLSPMRYSLYAKCKEAYGWRNVWTLDNLVYCIDTNSGSNVPFIVHCEEELCHYLPDLPEN